MTNIGLDYVDPATPSQPMRGVEPGSEHYFQGARKFKDRELHPFGLLQQVLWLNVQSADDSVSFAYPALVFVLIKWAEIKKAVQTVAKDADEEELNRRTTYQWHSTYTDKAKVRTDVSEFIASFTSKKDLREAIKLAGDIIKEAEDSQLEEKSPETQPSNLPGGIPAPGK